MSFLIYEKETKNSLLPLFTNIYKKFNEVFGYHIVISFSIYKRIYEYSIYPLIFSHYSFLRFFQIMNQLSQTDSFKLFVVFLLKFQLLDYKRPHTPIPPTTCSRYRRISITLGLSWKDERILEMRIPFPLRLYAFSFFFVCRIRYFIFSLLCVRNLLLHKATETILRLRESGKWERLQPRTGPEYPITKNYLLFYSNLWRHSHVNILIIKYL